MSGPPVSARRLSRRNLLGAALLSLGGLAAACRGGGKGGGADAQPTPTEGPPSPTPGGPPTPLPTSAAGLAVPGWSQPMPIVAPSPRRDHAMTFGPPDADSAYLYGGEGGTGLLNDFWTWDYRSQQWAQTPVSGPPAAAGHFLAFDAAASQVVLFGGRGPAGLLPDAWTIDPSSGTARRVEAGGGPAPRQHAACAFDAAARRLYVAFGQTAEGIAPDIWALDLATPAWTRVSTSGQGPQPRAGARAVWDTSSSRLMLFGGQDGAGSLPNDLWALDPAAGTWEAKTPQVPPPGRTGFIMVVDEGSGLIVVVSGQTSSGQTIDVWVFDPGRGEWGHGQAFFRQASKREGAAAAYDPHRRSLAVFGGNGESGLLGDTWELGLGPPR